MSSRSRRSSTRSRQGRPAPNEAPRQAGQTGHPPASCSPSTDQASQSVTAELAELVATTVRAELAQLSAATAPPPTTGTASSTAILESSDPNWALPPPSNLLGTVGPPTEVLTSSSSGTTSSALPSVPTKLAQRILRGEYINLDDLLPETLSKQPREPVQWQATDGQAPLTISLPDTTTRRKVVDMSSWVQAYTVYAATALRWAPERGAELLGYQALISQAFQNFTNSAVLSYDRELRALVSQNADRRFDIVDTTLWAVKFTGQARPSCPRCTIQHSRNHCFQSGRRDHAGAISSNSGNSGHVQPQRSTAEREQPATCRNYNKGLCKFAACTRPHVCLNCGGSHPAFRCDSSTGRSQ